jgi:hypothetical protein
VSIPDLARRLLLAVAAGGLSLGPALAADRPAASGAGLAPVQVKDLHYGDVLFHFYQEDYFAALTRLSAAAQQGRLKNHAHDAELLLGGLYLSLGQHREAGRIFSDVLERPGVPGPVRDRARFFLGKVWYQRGHLAGAVETLSAASSGSLAPEMEAERRMLLAQSLMRLQRYDEAIGTLQDWRGPRTWTAYAQYNLGVALVRSGRLDDGARLLDQVGRHERPDAELYALRDKANLALGYAYLQANRPEAARPVLERVRLEGPLSTKALLGVGWADTGSERYRSALVPWLELQGRNLLDSAVQESYLAVPFAFAKLGANRQAVDHYESAIREFGAEAARIDESIAAIQRGGMLEAIVRNEQSQSGPVELFWQLTSLPDAPESRYLYHLLAGHEFQEGLKNFRMLEFMERNLEAWLVSVDAFDDLLATQRQRFAALLPQAQAQAHRETASADALRRRTADIESRLASAEAHKDYAALASRREQAISEQVEQLEARAAAGDPDDPNVAAAREKLRLLRGVNEWQISEGSRARTWTVRRNLREIDGALRDTETRSALVQHARAMAPDRTEQLAARISILGPRIETARARLGALKHQQQRYLADIAIGELEQQKKRLDTYLVQARYALATVYDRASADAGGAR